MLIRSNFHDLKNMSCRQLLYLDDQAVLVVYVDGVLSARTRTCRAVVQARQSPEISLILSGAQELKSTSVMSHHGC